MSKEHICEHPISNDQYPQRLVDHLRRFRRPRPFFFQPLVLIRRLGRFLLFHHLLLQLVPLLLRIPPQILLHDPLALPIRPRTKEQAVLEFALPFLDELGFVCLYRCVWPRMRYP
jgi:hypothetical protein